MRIIPFLFLALFTTTSAHAEMKWSGGAGIRHLRRDINDGLETRNAAGKDSSKSYERRYELRGNIGLSDTGENVDWTIAMRTASSATSEWVQFNNAADLGFNLEQANVRLHTSAWANSDWAVTIGRQKMGLIFDSFGQSLFSKTARWDGLSWNWKKNSFGLNASQYVLGATNRGTPLQASTFTSTEATQGVSDTRSHFNAVYSVQGVYDWKMDEETKVQFAVGYHVWQGSGGSSTVNGYTNTVHGGTAGTVGNINPVIMDGARQIQVLADVVLPYTLRFVAEFVRNKTVYYGTTAVPTTVKADRNGYALSLVYGVAKKKGSWTGFYTYSDRGIASAISRFANADIASDNRSHMFEAKYMAADNVALGARLQYHKEKARLGGDGVALASPNEKRRQSHRRLELYSAISF